MRRKKLSSNHRCCFVGDPKALSFEGRFLREVLLALRKYELPISLEAKTSYGHCADLKVAQFIQKLMQRPPVGDIRLICGNLYTIKERKDSKGYWVYANFCSSFFNKHDLKILDNATSVLVPSKLHYKALCESGVKASKLKVVEPGVDKDVFEPNAYKKHKIKNFKYDDKYFYFVAVSSPLWRKGLDILIEAYFSEFKANENVKLLLILSNREKPRKKYSYEINDLSNRLGAITKDFAKVEIVEGYLTNEEMAYYLSLADALVCCNRMFFSALVVREAMACGTCIIAPQTILDLLPECKDKIIAIKTNIVSAEKGKIHKKSPPTNVYEPNISELRQAMRYIYDNKAYALEIGKELHKLAKSYFITWKDVTKKIYSLLADRGTVMVKQVPTPTVL